MYSCSNCDKAYKHRQNLYRHKLKCKTICNEVENNVNNQNVAFLEKNREQCSHNLANIENSHNQKVAVNDYNNNSSFSDNNNISEKTYKCNYCNKKLTTEMNILIENQKTFYKIFNNILIKSQTDC